MKKLLMVVCFMLTVVNFASAQLWVEGQHNYITYSNGVMDGSRPQEKLLAGWKYVYLWGSMDGENSLDYGGQEGINFKLPGVGVGVRVPILKYLSCYLEGGYFKPDYDGGWYTQGSVLEGFIRYGREKTAYERSVVDEKWWDKGKMTMDGGFGGEAGLQVSLPLIWGFDLTAKTGYRYLKLDQHFLMKDYETTASRLWWEFDDQVDMSGIVMGVGLKYEF